MKQWVDAILLHFEQSQHRRRQPSNGQRDAQPASATAGIGIHRIQGSVKLAGAQFTGEVAGNEIVFFSA